MNKAFSDIKKERLRQIKKGFSQKHDDECENTSNLIKAASCYAVGEKLQVMRGFRTGAFFDSEPNIVNFWPWENSSWKPKNTRKNLVKAAALIVAAIEQIDRKGAKKANQ